MALSKTEICNLALAKIGKEQGIANLDTEQSKAARICRQLYPIALDWLLGDFEWSFATSVVKLASPSGDVPIGWGYQYALPADCLSALKVCDYSGARTWSRSSISLGDQVLAVPDFPFRVMRSASAGTRVIVTDLPEAYLIYTARIETVTDYSAQFVQALTWLLASELAMPMAVEPGLADRARQGFGIALSEAKNKDARIGVDDPRPESPSVQVR